MEASRTGPERTIWTLVHLSSKTLYLRLMPKQLFPYPHRLRGSHRKFHEEVEVNSSPFLPLPSDLLPFFFKNELIFDL